jgi:hypothetical protein
VIGRIFELASHRFCLTITPLIHRDIAAERSYDIGGLILILSGNDGETALDF